MTILITIVHIIVCLSLIVIILLQTGKGAGLGAAFGGGGGQTLFGSTGGATFLNKFTTAAAVIFMVTCLSLAYLSSNQKTASIMDHETAPATSTTPDKAN